MRSSASLLLLVAVLLTSNQADAHEYWLSPSSYSAPIGQTLAVQAYVGSDFVGELRPFATTRTVRLEVRDRERKDVKDQALNGDLDLAHFTVPDDGGIAVAFETNFVQVELPPDKFDEYLRKEGLEGPLQARAALGSAAGPGRERYLRCAKTWIAGRDNARLEKPFGMPLEIVPKGDPLAAGKLSVQVLLNGQPIEGILVKAWNQPLASGAVPREQMSRAAVKPSAQMRTGKDGGAELRLDDSGEWLLSAVHMQASSDKQAADWESRWASLTFARVPKK